jgi:hypothetical protein
MALHLSLGGEGVIVEVSWLTLDLKCWHRYELLNQTIRMWKCLRDTQVDFTRSKGYPTNPKASDNTILVQLRIFRYILKVDKASAEQVQLGRFVVEW